MLFPSLLPAMAALLATAGPLAVDDSASTEIFVRAHEIHVRPGLIINDGAVLVRDGVIVAVGKDLTAPEDAQVVEGDVVCAGYMDPWSSLGLDSSSVSDYATKASTETALAVDGFGQVHERAAARDAGVLLVRSQAGNNAQTGGLGSVLQSAPGGEVVLADACLQFTCGVGRPGTGDLFERIGEADMLSSALKSGLKYRESLVEFRYELEAWEKQIAEEEAELEKDFKKAKKARAKDKAKAEEKDKEFKEKKYKEDKKPRAPKFDADKAVLARAAHGELPIVIGVNGGPEMRAVLAAIEDFGRCRFILRGAAGSLPFAEEIAKRGIPVIVTPNMATGRSDDSADLAAALAAKGVTVLLGSGGGVASVRDLPILAQRAMGSGLSAKQAFHALTLGAAQAFDVADRFGSVEVGKRAELLILNGAPVVGRPTAVITGGKVLEL